MKIVISQKSLLEKQLDFQEVARLNTSDEYYTPAIDFLARLYSTEFYTGKNLKVFSNEFRTYVASKGLRYGTIFGNGALKVAVMKITKSDPGESSSEKNSRDEYQMLKQILIDTKKELGFAATFEYNRDKRYHVIDEYVACFPGKAVKLEEGKWKVVEKEGGAAQFFALMVVRGLIDEQYILESRMATLGVRGLDFRKHFLKAVTRLRNKGLVKLINEPLHKIEQK